VNAERLMLLGGCGAFLLTVAWVRTRELREKYAVTWLAVATLLLLCGLFPAVLESLAHRFRLSYPAAVLFFSLTGIYVFSFGVSVSLTRHHRQNVRLTQDVALLEHRLRQLEEALVKSNAAPADPCGQGVPPTGE